MKTYQRLREDLEQRRHELAQRQREKLNDFVSRSKEKAQAQRAQQQAQIDRENLKKEIKSELKRES